jgi:hypothetical protein
MSSPDVPTGVQVTYHQQYRCCGKAGCPLEQVIATALGNVVSVAAGPQTQLPSQVAAHGSKEACSCREDRDSPQARIAAYAANHGAVR